MVTRRKSGTGSVALTCALLFLTADNAAAGAESKSGTPGRQATPGELTGRHLEIVGLEVAPTILSPRLDAQALAGFSIFMRLFTLEWEHVYWTPLELGGGMYDMKENNGYLFAGTEIGAPIPFGDEPGHQFKVGLALGGGAIDTYDQTSYEGFILAPTARYQFRLFDWMTVGAGLRIMLPMNTTRANNRAETPRYGPQFLAFLDLGFQDTRVSRTGGRREHRTTTEYCRISALLVPFDHGYDSWDDNHNTWGFFGPGATISGPTIRWDHFYLTPAQVTLLLSPGALVVMAGGVRLGYPLFLDEDGRHEIDFGSGFEFGMATYSLGGDYAKSGGGLGLIVSPSIGYSYTTDLNIVVGTGIKAIIPTPAAFGWEGEVVVLALSLDLAFR